MAAPGKIAGAREHTGDRQLDAMQERIRKLEAIVNACPFVGGVMRSVTLVAGTPKKVDHGLGVRAAFIVARSNYATDDVVIRETLSQTDVDLTKSLKVQVAAIGGVVGATGTFDLWFYPKSSEAFPR